MTIPHGGSTDVLYSNEVYDASSSYNPTTGIYTIPEEGVYSFSYSTFAYNNSKVYRGYASIYLNGSEIAR